MDHSFFLGAIRLLMLAIGSHRPGPSAARSQRRCRSSKRSCRSSSATRTRSPHTKARLPVSQKKSRYFFLPVLFFNSQALQGELSDINTMQDKLNTHVDVNQVHHVMTQFYCFHKLFVKKIKSFQIFRSPTRHYSATFLTVGAGRAGRAEGLQRPGAG